MLCRWIRNKYLSESGLVNNYTHDKHCVTLSQASALMQPKMYPNSSGGVARVTHASFMYEKCDAHGQVK